MLPINNKKNVYFLYSIKFGSSMAENSERFQRWTIGHFLFHIHHCAGLVPLTVDALLWSLRSVSLCRELGASWRTQGLWVGTPTLTYHPGSTLQHGVHWLDRGREEQMSNVKMF